MLNSFAPLKSRTHNSRRGNSWPSMPWHRWVYVFLGLGIVALMLLTPAYLLFRAWESGEAASELVFSTRTLATLGRTVGLSVGVTLATIGIAVPLAWLTTCTDLPARRFWSVSATLPLVVPSYVAAYLFVTIFGPKGFLQQALFSLFGIERIPEVYGFPGALVVLTLISYPYTYLSVRAALKRVDPSQAEAARSLGLSAWQQFFRVTLPQLRPAVVAGSLLVCLYVLRDFGAVTMLRFDTFTRIIFVQYNALFDRALAAALALVLVALTVVILVLERRSRGRAHYERLSAGAARQPKLVTLGKWRWPALAFVAAIVSTALFIPAGTLIYWVIRGLRQDFVGNALAGAENLGQMGGVWEAAYNSVSASFLAAALTVILAIPVAIMAVRRPSRWSKGVEQITYSGFALPGIVIALALVFFGARYLPGLYQTLPLLLAAYVILFLPQAIGSTRASLLQVSPSLEEAGRSLGYKPVEVLRRITLPLVSPGVLAGGALVFLTVMKELPATLLLSPLGFSSLATMIWSNISEAFFAQAAIPTLLLILLSSLPLAWLTIKEKH